MLSKIERFVDPCVSNICGENVPIPSRFTMFDSRTFTKAQRRKSFVKISSWGYWRSALWWACARFFNSSDRSAIASKRADLALFPNCFRVLCSALVLQQLKSCSVLEACWRQFLLWDPLWVDCCACVNGTSRTGTENAPSFEGCNLCINISAAKVAKDSSGSSPNLLTSCAGACWKWQLW